jgi:hypothetical protein
MHYFGRVKREHIIAALTDAAAGSVLCFLATLGAEETQIEASLSEAVRIAKEQKSASLQKRAEATYAEYDRQKASARGGRGFRLPLG